MVLRSSRSSFDGFSSCMVLSGSIKVIVRRFFFLHGLERLYQGHRSTVFLLSCSLAPLSSSSFVGFSSFLVLSGSIKVIVRRFFFFHGLERLYQRHHSTVFLLSWS